MAGETIVTVVGNLTADPELRTIPSGSVVANFTVASTPSTWDARAGQWVDGEPMFLRCSAWDGRTWTLATNIAQSLSKGQRVVVQGRLGQHSYQAQDGTNRTVTELRVTAIGPDLSNQIAVCEKTSGSNASAPASATPQPGYQGGFAGAARNRQQPQQPAGEESQEPWAAGATYGSGYGEEPEF
ncbi:single-stranded DNA-binding protein [Bifidobacterium vansinderenii]|uniref:Single-stranded DNA-binding protein n=1 Tax=Bifidobacterium vansinderenii TaxID=1984871 RepID=A0A229W0P2_9BIFI|nr:single-stranded DNA-binding protein [Bifidobacterium vansinderenii]OXN01449.1 single-stranded DNA-binding protein [Bifidobacterium vansinderenii]